MLCVIEYINLVSIIEYAIRLPFNEERDYARNSHGSDVASYNMLIWYVGNEKFRCYFFFFLVFILVFLISRGNETNVFLMELTFLGNIGAPCWMGWVNIEMKFFYVVFTIVDNKRKRN